MDKKLNIKTDARNQDLQSKSDFEPVVMAKLILYHGSNKLFKYLRPESFLTTDVLQAAHFAQIKGGGIVYQFLVDDDEVYRDDHTPQCEWYLSSKKLKPINQFSV